MAIKVSGGWAAMSGRKDLGADWAASSGRKDLYAGRWYSGITRLMRPVKITRILFAYFPSWAPWETVKEEEPQMGRADARALLCYPSPLFYY